VPLKDEFKLSNLEIGVLGSLVFLGLTMGKFLSQN
jgi:hypothetical protein